MRCDSATVAACQQLPTGWVEIATCNCVGTVEDVTMQPGKDARTERRVAVGCLCCWFSVWHYQMPLVRLLLLPASLPRLGISGCHFWGSLATATLEQLWADEQSVIDTAAAPSRSSRRWTLECGAAQVWRRVMFVCRRPGVRFYSYLDWPTRFLTHCCCRCCCCSGCCCSASVPKWHSFALQGNCTWMCPVWGLMLSMWAWPASYSGKRRWQICQKNESSMSCRMPALTSSSHSLSLSILPLYTLCHVFGTATARALPFWVCRRVVRTTGSCAKRHFRCFEWLQLRYGFCGFFFGPQSRARPWQG